ncbi:PspC domain-containing protein [Actinopolymorpha singaporensis]|uniref:Phage shock protein PspC (Stress-responsive transcriptional regulator) n=1 Tax=Actinopolymorpha singaporensis TaxID=117157 RepID=A0A1H1SHS6_9ACTN|nr:PspC domain-containing protein [Actinopolymorpha singaporensis]SDS47535.1 Phage shock protein PspC (stress-responsive transcriptional regulator) [Actinopolymorpha singaporensis]
MNEIATQKKLVRTRDERMIAGVCGGIARYAGLDPVIIRLALAASILLGGAGVVLYIAAWIIVPEEDTATA